MFFFNDPPTTQIYTLSLHDALPISVALTFPVTRKVLGANETVSMGFIGVGGRGEHSADWFSKVQGVRIAAACDADAARTAKVDRKSTRLNSSHSQISYAVFCLKKKK